MASEKEIDFETHFSQLVSLIQKIDRWWIVNVEIATDPEMCDKEIDEDGILSARLILIQILSQVALGNDEEAWWFFNEFKKHTIRVT